MYPAPSSPWSVHPDTNSHPKLETGTPPCSGPPLPASLPPCFPSSRVSRAGPSSVGMSQGCGECGTAPLSCGNAPGMSQPPCPVVTRGCWGPLGPSRVGLGSHQLFVLLALVVVFSHVLGLAGFGFLVGFGWLCPGFRVLIFLRALPPPCPFSSLQGKLESVTSGSPACAQ